MSQRDLKADALRGRKAAAELEETQAAFEAVRAALTAALARTPVGADAKVLKLHMSLQNLAAVREAVTKTIAAGEHADYARAAEEALAKAGLTRA
jgi:hypothetical protein